MNPVTNENAIKTSINDSLARCKVQELLDLVERQSSDSTEAIAAGFDWLKKFAESLPLTTNEFAFVSNWITSARRYWQAGDKGAARYQINMVWKKLSL
jgi:hypothetical protein